LAKKERKGKGTEGEKKEKPQKNTKHEKQKREAIRIEKKKKELGENHRYIVRIMNKDLDGTLPINRAITKLKGINTRLANIIAQQFQKETQTPPTTLLGKLPEEKDKQLENIIQNPQEHQIPTWTYNRQKDRETGKNMHIVMGELDFAKRTDIQRLNEIKSYRGLRLQWKLPVRGQRTKSTHRGKGRVVGVIKKDAKK
jgi:small subunit ribosomal protein S13